MLRIRLKEGESVGIVALMSDGQGSAGNVIAALCSFICPGLGQLVQGRWLAGMIFFIGAGIAWIFFMGWLIHLWSCVNAAMWKPRE